MKSTVFGIRTNIHSRSRWTCILGGVLLVVKCCSMCHVIDDADQQLGIKWMLDPTPWQTCLSATYPLLHIPWCVDAGIPVPAHTTRKLPVQT